jgi:hypothetical protein
MMVSTIARFATLEDACGLCLSRNDGRPGRVYEFAFKAPSPWPVPETNRIITGAFSLSDTIITASRAAWG